MTEFSGLFSGNPGLCWGLILLPGLMSSSFVVCFDITIFGDEP